MSPRRRPSSFPPPRGAAEHLEREMAWYDGQARRSMVLYRVMGITELVAAAGVTVLASAADWPLLVSVLGALIAVMVGLRGMFKLPDVYIGYRAAAEAIRVQADLWANQVAPYDGADRDDVLVTKLAAIHGAELEGWLALVRSAER